MKFFNLKNICSAEKARQGKAAALVPAVAPDGELAGTAVPWAMPLRFLFTEKAVEAHRQSHPRGERWGRKQASRSPGVCPSHYTMMKGLLHSVGLCGWKPFQSLAALGAEQKGRRGLNAGRGRGLQRPGRRGEAAVRAPRRRSAKIL